MHLKKFGFHYFLLNLLCVICIKSLPSRLATLVPMGFVIISFVFFLVNYYFSVFLQFKCDFVCGQKNSKHKTELH